MCSYTDMYELLYKRLCSIGSKGSGRDTRVAQPLLRLLLNGRRRAFEARMTLKGILH